MQHIFSNISLCMPLLTFNSLRSRKSSRRPRNYDIPFTVYLVLSIMTSREFARVFGVDFFSVLSRGSQYKVESFMFRLAKPESFVLISPSKADVCFTVVLPIHMIIYVNYQVGKQNGAECMPLIMEPQSAFYSSPLLVLDFQSLYPSLMIAYNYCYSTCLGRVSDFQGRNQFGVVDDLKLPPNLLEKLQSHITGAYLSDESASLLIKMLC